MLEDIMQFQFAASVPMAEVRATLRLARMAVESLYGVDRVRLEAQCSADDINRGVQIGIGGRAGRALALVFAGYVRREFGPDAIDIEHVLAKPELAAGGAR